MARIDCCLIVPMTAECFQTIVTVDQTMSQHFSQYNYYKAHEPQTEPYFKQ